MVYAVLISQMDGRDTMMVLWNISFIRGCSQDKIRRKKSNEKNMLQTKFDFH